MPLNFEKLINSINALNESITTIDRDNIEEDAILYRVLKMAVIQSVEVAYEQSWKMMRRWLEINVGRDVIS